MKNKGSIGPFRKLYRSVRGHLRLIVNRVLCALASRTWSVFDDEIYLGKRVIVVGPAASSLSYLPGAEIDKFDLVVRINKSPTVLAGKEAQLGSRTDILYHCCYEDPVNGGGKIDPDLLLQQGVQTVVYTYAENSYQHHFFRCLWKYPSLCFSVTSADRYKELKGVFGNRVPTTGLQALMHIMQTQFAELHVTGFTFFHTAYAPGYRSGYETADKGRALAENSGNHDASLELQTFANAYARFHKEKNITLDPELAQLCRSVSV